MDNINLVLGALLGIAVGASIVVSALYIVAFVGFYVYEKPTTWEIKGYFIAFACIFLVFFTVSYLSLREVYDPLKAIIRPIWDSKHLWWALFLTSIVVVCCSMYLFFIRLEQAGRISLRAPPTIRQRVLESDRVQTDIPARLDRLPWGAFHTLVAVSLAVTWILNGLEVTLASNLQSAMLNSPSLNLGGNAKYLGYASGAYLLGTVLGALFFGWLTDRLGRKRLFFVTLFVYLFFTALTGTSWNIGSLILFRFLTGMGIGGEYAAINSTVQELIPAKFRGRTDLLIGGTFWIGAAMAAIGSTLLLGLDAEYGWRAAFLIGALLALVVLRIRRSIPESPRWLVTHNRVDEANAIVEAIEERFRDKIYINERLQQVQLIGRSSTPIVEVVRTIFKVYPSRAFLSFTLMAAQALVYNAIFFNHPLMLGEVFNVPASSVGWYFLPFAIGNFFGPLLLGPWFDKLGRRLMISSTYFVTGVLIAVNAYLFQIGVNSALTLSLGWMITFFFGSAAASAAYLTAGEIFPLEIRALAIAFFFAIGTGFGGVPGSYIFSVLLATQNHELLFIGYLLLSIAMILAALIELRWGVDAECKPLESVAPPLTLAPTSPAPR